LAQHLAILEAARSDGIEATYEELRRQQELDQQALPDSP
jgi:hypothetical protein